MNNYSAFASIYDLFMDNIPYEIWADYIKYLLYKNNIKLGSIVELGCGTGNITVLLARQGYDMVGIDFSEEMLAIASSKSYDSELEILYSCQDMRTFKLHKNADAIISICDSMNYLLEEEDLFSAFQAVSNSLNHQGVFIFDLNTEYYYREVLADETMAENKEQGSIIWENTYYEEEKINVIDLTMFIKEHRDCYKKYEEEHCRRAYDIDTIIDLLHKANLKVLNIYDAFTEIEPNEKSERIYIVASKT